MHINKLKRTVCKSYEYITELADSLEAPPRFELGHKGFAVPENCLIEYLLFQKGLSQVRKITSGGPKHFATVKKVENFLVFP